MQASSAPAIPFRAEEALGAGGALSLVLALLLALAALGLLWWLRRRMGLAGPRASIAAGPLRVIARQRLGARSSLTVVEFDGRLLLLAEGEGGVRCLARSASGAAP